MTYKIQRTVDGYPSKNSTYETGLTKEQAMQLLAKHKINMRSDITEETDESYTYDNEQGTTTTVSIEQE